MTTMKAASVSIAELGTPCCLSISSAWQIHQWIADEWHGLRLLAWCWAG
jgi:hypothetical protein